MSAAGRAPESGRAAWNFLRLVSPPAGRKFAPLPRPSLRHIQLRAEAFNVFNHANLYIAPGTNDAATGAIQAVRGVTPNPNESATRGASQPPLFLPSKKGAARAVES